VRFLQTVIKIQTAGILQQNQWQFIVDHEEALKLLKEQLKEQEVKSTDFQICYKKLLAQFHVKEAEAK
jgi:hypothetical protein